MDFSLEFTVREVAAQIRKLECANITPSKVFIDAETYMYLRNSRSKYLQYRYTSGYREEWLMGMRLYEVQSNTRFVVVA